MLTSGLLLSRRKSLASSSAHLQQWLDCPQRSSIIADRFIACKTPLDVRYNTKVPVTQQWTCQMLVDSGKSVEKKIGLVISLMNCDLFYNSKAEFAGKGILYQQIVCDNEKEVPSYEQVQCFMDICNEFVASHPDDLIVVHCTYGFNLTGFFISTFLYREMDMSIDAALSQFSQARPPGIHNQSYLDKLLDRLDDEDTRTLVKPTLPGWCLTKVDHDDEPKRKRPSTNKESSVFTKRFRKKEQTGLIPQFAVPLSDVTPVREKFKWLPIRRKCQRLCGWTGRGFPGSRPICMNLGNYQTIFNSPYMVTWTSVGTRYLMFIEDENRVFMIDINNHVFIVNHLRFPHDSDCHTHLRETLLDGELVIDQIDDLKIIRFLITDIIAYHGTNVADEPLPQRLKLISGSIIHVRQEAMRKGHLVRATQPLSIRSKDCFDLPVVAKLLSPKFRAQVPHEIEGLLFLPKLEPYKPGRAVRVLEWKEKSSINFRLKLSIPQPHSCPHDLSKKRAFLFVQHMPEPFAEMSYSSSLNEYDGMIISCWFIDGQWHFRQLRSDRWFPDGKDTAFEIIEAIRRPLTAELLCDLAQKQS